MISRNRMIREPPSRGGLSYAADVGRLPQRRADGSPLARTRCRSESVDVFRQPAVARLLERRLRGGGLVDRPRRERQRQGRGADFTPLHWAAGDESLRPHLVKLLLGSGADPNAAGGESVGALGLVPQTPRLIAEKRGRTAIVDALVAAGAKEQPQPERDRHAASHASGGAREFDIDRFGREGAGGVANDRGPIARGVPPARQQTRLRLVPPAVLADGRRGPRP